MLTATVLPEMASSATRSDGAGATLEDRRIALLRERFPEQPLDALAVSLAISRASVTIDRAVAEVLRPAGLTPVAMQTLISVFLADPGPLSLKALGAELRVTKANVSLVLASLEKQALVRRKADRSDARKIRATVTPKGERLIEKLLPDILACIEDALGAIGGRERHTLKRLAEKVS